MMLEEELRKRILLRYNGAYSINPGSKEVLESLDYTIELLSNPDNAVLFYPQGEIKSHYEETFNYNKGINYILKGLPQNVMILLTASFIDYGSERKPTVNIFYKSIKSEEITDSDSFRKFFQDFYQKSKMNHIKLMNN